MTTGKNPNNPMADDYLWDPASEPSPDVVEMETALGGLRHRGITLRRPAPRYRGAVVSVALLLIATATFSLLSADDEWLPLDGMNGEGRLHVGNWLEPDSDVTIELGAMGDVTVGANSRLRILETRDDQHRLELERGSIDAFVTAPPRMFFVETPAGVAVDLGCAYTLDVDEEGVSRLNVSLGWVALEREGRTSTVPSSASCYMYPGRGPGTPVFNDASDEFKSALLRLDEQGADAGVLDEILAHTRERDTLSLYHLLAVVDGQSRTRIFDRLDYLAPMPAGVTRQGVLDLDDAMLYRWWNSLQLTW
jgi:hypothetical protein